MADPLTELQQALRKLPKDRAMEILDLLEKLCRNVLSNPGEAKYRSVKVNTAKTQPLLGIQASQDVMIEIGWRLEGECLVLPEGVRLDFQAHVVKIIEARDFYKKEAEKAKKFERLAADPAKAETQRQMAIDRAERAAAHNAARAAPVQAPPASPSPAAPPPAAATPPAAARAPAPSPAATPLLAAPVQEDAMADSNAKATEATAESSNKALEDIRSLQQKRYESAKDAAPAAPAPAPPPPAERKACCPCFS